LRACGYEADLVLRLRVAMYVLPHLCALEDELAAQERERRG
jgi:hypothetical protein